LARFPSDLEIKNLAGEAADEMKSIVSLLGLVPGRLLGDRHANSATILPSIDTWFKNPNKFDGDVFADVELGYESEGEDDCDAEELQQLLDSEENTCKSRTNKQDDSILSLALASVALTVDDMIKMFVIVILHWQIVNTLLILRSAKH
jgi:hypothetical protein